MILPGLCVAWFVAFRLSNSNRVKKLELAVRQRGEPLTLAELEVWQSMVPDAENAAVPLMRLWEKEDSRFWKAFASGESPLPQRVAETINPAVPFLGKRPPLYSRSQPLPANSRAAADAYLDQQREHMLAVQEALQRAHCRFSVDYKGGYEALLPHVTAMKTEAQRFQLAALVAADRGDAEACIASLTDASRVGNALGENSWLINQIMRITCLTMVLEGTEYLLSRQSLSPHQLDEVGILLEHLRITNGLRMALIAERPTVLSVFDMPAAALQRLLSSDPAESGGQGFWSYRAGLAILKVGGVATIDRRITLETLERGIALAEQSSPEALVEIEQIFQKVHSKGLERPPKIISAVFLPALGRAADKFAVLEARRRSGLVALAVEKYRDESTRTLPEHLDALPPQFLASVPLDPFTGESLRYRRLTRGYVVYSTGVDRHDNGGKQPSKPPPQRTSSESVGYDEVFVVER